MTEIRLTEKPHSGSSEPLTCALDTADMQAQMLEWRDLSAIAIAVEATQGGVVSEYPIDWADAVADLARREEACCGSWLTAATTRLSDRIRLTVTTDRPDGVALIRSLAGLGDR